MRRGGRSAAGRQDAAAGEDAATRPARVPVALSTASTYPESTTSAFELAARLGYDGVEVMVGLDPVSQDVAALRDVSAYHGVPVVAVHVPCLLVTQRVWGTEPWGKLERSVQMAAGLGAGLVVVHPPFRWQRDYARTFVDGVRALEQDSGIDVAVENMYPWRAAGREVEAYAPGWDPGELDFDSVVLDLSHSAITGTNPVQMAAELGARLRHVHLADGSGSAKDEHLVPGRGSQPCAQVLQLVAGGGFSGTVVVEINTRRSAGRDAREQDLAESLAFAREHLAPVADYAVASDGTVEPRAC